MLRLAIVGAGIMGANHARVAMGLRDARVTTVIDPDTQRGRALADSVGARHAANISEILEEIDAAILAVPSVLHREIGLHLIRAGVNVLVEKPLAPTVEDAAALVEAAESCGVVMMVGHVERFNPSVLELDRLVTDAVHIEARRFSSFSPRVQDDVILDMMIHDLDIALSLTRSRVSQTTAVSRQIRSANDDHACALLQFENGTTANLTASRVGQEKIRQLVIVQRDNVISVDLLRQDLTVSRVDHSEYLSSTGSRYRQSGVVEIPFLEHRGEPLYLQLSHFVECVRSGSKPRVSGRDGLEALRAALQVREIATRQPNATVMGAGP